MLNSNFIQTKFSQLAPEEYSRLMEIARQMQTHEKNADHLAKVSDRLNHMVADALDKSLAPGNKAAGKVIRLRFYSWLFNREIRTSSITEAPMIEEQPSLFSEAALKTDTLRNWEGFALILWAKPVKDDASNRWVLDNPHWGQDVEIIRKAFGGG